MGEILNGAIPCHFESVGGDSRKKAIFPPRQMIQVLLFLFSLNGEVMKWGKPPSENSQHLKSIQNKPETKLKESHKFLGPLIWKDHPEIFLS
jgi:hypothetical protein